MAKTAEPDTGTIRDTEEPGVDERRASPPPLLQSMPFSVISLISRTETMQAASAREQAQVKRERAGANWKADVPASIVVFLIAVPLCLGIALASGAPLFAGIIAGIAGGLVVGSLSESQLLVSGPAAGLTAIVLSAIATLGSFRAFLVAVVLGGAMQVVLGVLGAGVIGYVFPNAVIKGMLAAIGLILILKQIPHALGYDANYQGDETFQQANQENTFTSIVSALERPEAGAMVLSVVALALLILWDNTGLKKMRLLPGPLAVVVVGMILNALFSTMMPAWHLTGMHLVSLPVADSLAGLAAYFTFPDWSVIGDPTVWRVAATVGVVASLESLLSLSATNRIDPYRREPSPNREMIAQGCGNMASGLIGGLPVTGVIVRSAANVDAGAQTKRSTIMHGALLLLAATLLPWLLNRIPIAPLAAILIYTGFKLAHPRLLSHAWRQGIHQFIPFIVTVVAILLTDLLVGIALGMVIGLFFVLIENLRTPSFTIVSPKGAVLTRIRLNEKVTFLNKASLAQTLEKMPEGSRIELDGRNCKRIDHDVLELIHEFAETARLRNIDFRLVGIPDQPIMPSH